MQSENAVITFELVAAPGGGGGAAAEDLRGHGHRHHRDGGRGCDGAAAGAAGEVRGHVARGSTAAPATLFVPSSASSSVLLTFFLIPAIKLHRAFFRLRSDLKICKLTFKNSRPVK